jgi:hypothetical protein
VEEVASMETPCVEELARIASVGIATPIYSSEERETTTWAADKVPIPAEGAPGRIPNGVASISRSSFGDANE